MQRPNFLFLGPDKSGSTWLYNALRHHNRVYLPNSKELFFFDQFYHLGWDWYEKYFRAAGDDYRVLGEISHDYLFSTVACERIADDLPSVKLMVCLREPAQRAFSSYLYMVKQGRVRTDFDTAITEVEELVDHGRYAMHVSRYLKLFGRERIHVSIFDDLVADPQSFFDGVCDFLDIDRLQLPEELMRNVLPAARPRSQFWAGIARNMGWQIRRLGLPHVVGRIKEASFVNRVLYKPYASNDKPEMTASARNHLRTIFSPEVQRLDRLLGTELQIRWGYSTEPERINPRRPAKM